MTGAGVVYGDHLPFVEGMVQFGPACFVGFYGIDELLGTMCRNDAVTDLVAYCAGALPGQFSVRLHCDQVLGHRKVRFLLFALPSNSHAAAGKLPVSPSKASLFSRRPLTIHR